MKRRVSGDKQGQFFGPTVLLDIAKHTFKSPKFQSVVEDAIQFFKQTTALPFPPAVAFSKSGVYAIYYSGGFEHYLAIAKANKEESRIPIYVGKAVPPGWRTARVHDSESPDLYRRLNEHARTIQTTANLKLKDFKFRFMVLSETEGDLVVPIEAALIRHFRPLWNSVLDGFGNHDPGSGRYDQAKSEWDVVHPGRKWAKRLRGKSPDKDQVLRNIRRAMVESLLL